MATTPTHAIVYPVVGNTITPLATHFANLANSVDSALTAAINTGDGFIGTDAARVATIAPKLREGVTWYSNDTNRNWFYDGTNWLSADPGSYLLYPTSVVGGTVGTDGTITPTVGATTLSVNGVFTSRFRRYRLELYVTTPANAGSQLRLRNGGTDVSGTGYAFQSFWASGVTPTASVAGGQPQWNVAAMAGLWHAGTIMLTNPATVNGLKMMEVQLGTAASSSGVGWTSASGHNTAVTAATHDGFTFLLSSSSFAAESYFKVYGLA